MAGHTQTVPLGGLAHRLHQHLMAKLGNQARIFGDIDEGTWHEKRAVFIADANQRFGTSKAAVVGAQHWLIVHDKVVVLDGPTQLVLDFEPAYCFVAEVVVEHDREVAALFFGSMQRSVGIAQQVVGVLSAFGDGDADRGGDHGGLVTDADGLRQRLAKAAGSNDRIAATQHVGDNDSELIAAQAGHHIARTNNTLDT